MNLSVFRILWMKLSGGFWVYLPYSEVWENRSNDSVERKMMMLKVAEGCKYGKAIDFSIMSWGDCYRLWKEYRQ